MKKVFFYALFLPDSTWHKIEAQLSTTVAEVTSAVSRATTATTSSTPLFSPLDLTSPSLADKSNQQQFLFFSRNKFWEHDVMLAQVGGFSISSENNSEIDSTAVIYIVNVLKLKSLGGNNISPLADLSLVVATADGIGFVLVHRLRTENIFYPAKCGSRIRLGGSVCGREGTLVGLVFAVSSTNHSNSNNSVFSSLSLAVVWDSDNTKIDTSIFARCRDWHHLESEFDAEIIGHQRLREPARCVRELPTHMKKLIHGVSMPKSNSNRIINNNECDVVAVTEVGVLSYATPLVQKTAPCPPIRVMSPRPDDMGNNSNANPLERSSLLDSPTFRRAREVTLLAQETRSKVAPKYHHSPHTVPPDPHGSRSHRHRIRSLEQQKQKPTLGELLHIGSEVSPPEHREELEQNDDAADDDGVVVAVVRAESPQIDLMVTMESPLRSPSSHGGSTYDMSTFNRKQNQRYVF
eukprot:PhM_4_TR12700/c0_g1_i1/m.93798